MSEASSVKSITQKVIGETQAFNTLSQVLGISPISKKNDSFRPLTIYQTMYVSVILLLFVFELIYLVIYQEIVMGTHYSIMNLTHLFGLFAENIISCTCLVLSVVFSKMAYENFQSCIKVLHIFARLNLELDFFSTRRASLVYLVVAYGVVFQAGFALDYYLLFGNRKKSYISFQSWILFVIHICYNAFALLYTVFSLRILRLRFKVLNRAMKDLNSISEQNLMSEIQVLSLRKSNPVVLPLRERVRMIKEAHDRLYRVCTEGWVAQNQFALLEIVASGILITSYLYSMIGMVIDDELDTNLLIYFSYWILYRALIIAILVLSYDGVCKQCNQIAIVIHEILNRGETKDIYIQLKNFSLQRLHQKLKIMACGLFAIDNSLLFEISGEITNHLVILIQFKMLGDNTKTQTDDKE